MNRPQPYVCPTCREIPDEYFGRLVFPDELPHPPEYWEAIAAGGGQVTADPVPPTCPHHIKVQLIPVR